MLFKIIVDPNWSRRVSKKVKTNKNITTWSQNQKSYFFISWTKIKLNSTHFYKKMNPKNPEISSWNTWPESEL